MWRVTISCETSERFVIVLYKIFACWFGISTIMGSKYLFYAPPPLCMLQTILRSIRFQPGPSCFAVQQYWYWYSQYRVKANFGTMPCGFSWVLVKRRLVH